MSLEYIILIVVWVLSFLLIFAIPRDKLRVAMVAFLFKQMITWFLGLVVVELGLLVYPVRCLPEVNRTSFIYEYLAYPMVCAVFNARYPSHRSRWFQLGYYAAYCTVLTLTEVLIEIYTDLIEYIHWNWFWTWSSLFITFFMTRLFCVWFFKGFHSRQI
ncbi:MULTISPECIES: CBO0543 family protein [unclassified Paenibacillus]|uniref:CBO0543 family protein n=1 Tax=unclassified Paenibacillus TaxID=185978 RepID=UPI001B632050|nr:MULTISPECIES: CBO0543 family protein [unclassified Paenibacillus]MBP1155573.1 hypothetical protein [Paenibacillus sp. PvP091]MBP1169041.1 hypothetical protein [Paenibacillus sp. PvR098]MBP2440069.1 hypothetical protein [Paenibacillus sp. PvP052]